MKIVYEICYSGSVNNSMWSRFRARRGQAMVELALVIPMLVVLIMAIMEFGYYMFVMVSVNNATRAGCRTAALNLSNCAQVKAAVVANCTGVVLSTSAVTVTPTNADTTINGNPPTVTVEVNHSHKMFAPNLWQFSSLPIRCRYKNQVTLHTDNPTLFSCP